MKKVVTISAMIVALAGPSFAGGLADPIVEADPIVVEEVSGGGVGQGAIVAGIAALLLLAAASSSDDT